MTSTRQAVARVCVDRCDSSVNDLGVYSRSQDYGRARTCAAILLKSCLKQLKMFVLVGYVRKTTVKRSCKYGKYGMFELLILFL